MVEQARAAAVDLRDLVDAEETARGFDRRNAGPPQGGHRKTQDHEPDEAHRPLPLKQHRRRQQRQQDLESQFQCRRRLIARDVPDQRQRCADRKPWQGAGQRLAEASGKNARRAEQRERDQDRIFVIAIEDLRRDEPRKGATDHPAKGRAEIELRQPPRARPPRVKFAMAHQRQQREDDEVEGDGRQPEHLLAADQADRERRHRERNEAHHIGVRDPRPLAEHGDESQQVDRKRHHPQEWCGGDIGRQIGGDRDDEPRWHGGESDPPHPFAGTRADIVGGLDLCGDRLRARRQQPRPRLRSMASSAKPIDQTPACDFSVRNGSRTSG